MIAGTFPKRVCIVGGTGHTGERLARRLVRAGVETVVPTRDPNSPVARSLRDFGCRIVEGDSLRRWLLWQAMDGCHAIVSCAHIRYAEALVQACHRLEIPRLVCMSSARRYSRVPDPSVSEVLAGESLLMESELAWTIVRPTMIFGGSRDNNLTRLVGWVRRYPAIPVFGDGKSLVQPVFVEDVVTALAEALRRKGTAGRDYTVAGPGPMPLDEMIDRTARAAGRVVRLVHVPTPLGVTAARVLGPIVRRRGLTTAALRRMGEDKSADISNARMDLDFRPRSFDEAIAMKVSGEAEVDALYRPSATDG